jgi:4-hydroxyphenylacetate 3-monooxygenase
MIRSGSQYLESLQDGRRIYIGDEPVRDPTKHPAFRNAARTFAALYDLKADPALRDVMTFEEDGERYAAYFLRPRTKADLEKRTRAHRVIAEFSCGLLGRSPDALGSQITGMVMKPEVFDEEGGFREHVLALYQHMRANDLFATYAIVPPQGARNPEYYQTRGIPAPALRATGETDGGVVLNGMKMLATGAAVANEAIVGNILPLAPDQAAESITCIVPLNLSGLSLWARPPLATEVEFEFDKPLTWRFDESDCMLVFKDVEVPWERVIVHNNAPLSRNIFVQTPAHVMSNHQSTVRFATKLRFLLGIASLVTEATGARDIPAVRETLGRLAAMEAGYAAMVDGQLQAFEMIDHGYTLFNRRYMYAALNWAMENHSTIIDIIRELMGGGTFQMPASISVVRDPELRELFESYWSTSRHGAVERMKLFKLAWDLIGSEHASRATSYEKFFVGPAFSVRNYNFINTPWDAVHDVVERLMASYDVPPELQAATEQTAATD